MGFWRSLGRFEREASENRCRIMTPRSPPQGYRRISAISLHIVWNRSPGLRAVQPNSDGRSHVGRLIEAAHRDDEDVAVPRKQRCAAITTKLSCYFVATVRDNFVAPGNSPEQLHQRGRHYHVVTKWPARRLLAVAAITERDCQRLTKTFVTNRAALASSAKILHFAPPFPVVCRANWICAAPRITAL